MRARETVRRESLPPIAGFRATAAIGAWVKRSRRRGRGRAGPLTEAELEEVATKIQAGYRGMKAREEASRWESRDRADSGAELSASPASPDKQQAQDVAMVGAGGGRPGTAVDSGTSLSTSPRAGLGEDSSTGEESGEYSDTEEEDEEEEEEEEVEIKKTGKTPFVLLKQLVGIMKLGTGRKFPNKVGIVDNAVLMETEKDAENKLMAIKSENGNKVEEKGETVEDHKDKVEENEIKVEENEIKVEENENIVDENGEQNKIGKTENKMEEVGNEKKTKTKEHEDKKEDNQDWKNIKEEECQNKIKNEEKEIEN